MLKEIVISIQSYFQAHQFINKHQLWKWILIPGVIYALFFMVSMFFFGRTATLVIEYITDISGIRDWIQKLQNSWMGFFFTVAGIILWLILILLYFSMFKHFWLIVGSPIFSYLSEKTQAILDGNDYPFNFLNFLKDVWRGINLAFRNMLWQTVYLISILFLSFIPIVGWATPLIAMFIECYYYGFSMLDYSMERKRFSPQQSIAFISTHKGLAVGNGLVFYLMHGFIGIGWVLAPAYAVIAATISINKYES